MKRVCTRCKIYWDKKRGYECPECKAPAFFTQNSNDIGFAMYLRDQEESLSDYREVRP